eukprot:3046660-Pleurochrysis_carterae.AAC.1
MLRVVASFSHDVPELLRLDRQSADCTSRSNAAQYTRACFTCFVSTSSLAAILQVVEESRLNLEAERARSSEIASKIEEELESCRRNCDAANASLADAKSREEQLLASLAEESQLRAQTAGELKRSTDLLRKEEEKCGKLERRLEATTQMVAQLSDTRLELRDTRNNLNNTEQARMTMYAAVERLTDENEALKKELGLLKARASELDTALAETSAALKSALEEGAAAATAAAAAMEAARQDRERATRLAAQEQSARDKTKEAGRLLFEAQNEAEEERSRTAVARAELQCVVEEKKQAEALRDDSVAKLDAERERSEGLEEEKRLLLEDQAAKESEIGNLRARLRRLEKVELPKSHQDLKSAMMRAEAAEARVREAEEEVVKVSLAAESDRERALIDARNELSILETQCAVFRDENRELKGRAGGAASGRGGGLSRSIFSQFLFLIISLVLA